MICPKGYILAVEGLAKICIPDPQLYKRENGLYEPSWAPVFYNPKMIENRDICIAFLKMMLKERRDIVVLDPLAATGVRSIRIALEVDPSRDFIALYMGDISLNAVEIMRHNIELNNINKNIFIRHADANELIYQLVRREGIAPSYIDIDPFGSPAPFVYAALNGVKRDGIVALTATDLAVLEGRYKSKLFRRYGVVGVKAAQSKDIALRVLLSFIIRAAAIYDRYIEPVISYAMNHYVRVYVKVSKGGLKADKILKNCLGVAWCCTNCSYSYMEYMESNIYRSVRCPVCGGKLDPIYPIWICGIGDEKHIEKLVGIANEMYWLQKSSRMLLENIYRVSRVNSLITRLTYLAKVFKINVPSIYDIVECLQQKGFRASKSYIYSDGVATNASINDLIECMKR
jgi:tRNA (guanine26-N2/guanine27-N2)-dimethyltransferase